MKAIQYRAYGTPDVIQVGELARPTPKDHEVLVRILAASLSTADMAGRKGTPFIIRVFTGLRRPKAIPGSELSGSIEAIGKDVTRFRVGDRIVAATGAGMGAHAEYVVLPDDGALAHAPANLGLEEAVAVTEGGLTALPFLRDNGRIQRGQSILINGASGAVGTAAVQIAKYFGAHVTGVSSTRNLELVKSLGADEVIDYTAVDFTRTGKTYDIVFDAVGKSSFSRSRNSLKPGGVYLTTVPSRAIFPQMLWTKRFGNKRAVIAATGLRPAKDKAKDLALLKELLEAGTVRPVIDRRYPLEQMADAHQYVETGHKRGSVVITMSSA